VRTKRLFLEGALLRVSTKGVVIHTNDGPVPLTERQVLRLQDWLATRQLERWQRARRKRP
jgi:flagellar biosynthesis regulator FlbT